MKTQDLKHYIYWGTTALAVVACSVAFGFFCPGLRLYQGPWEKSYPYIDAHYLRGCAGLPDVAHL